MKTIILSILIAFGSITLIGCDMYDGDNEPTPFKATPDPSNNKDKDA